MDGDTLVRDQGGSRTKLQAEQAYQLLKRAIIRCELLPGEHVTEGQLEQRFKLKRAAVRTSLMRLYQEDLVEVIARRGYRVAPLTLGAVHDLCSVRLILEPAAMELVAKYPERITEIPRWSKISKGIRYRPGDPQSAEEFLRANTEFHTFIISASGNARLTRMLRDLLEEMERMFHAGFRVLDRNEEMYHEHDELIDALLSGDPPRAAAVAREGIIEARRMVLEAITSSPALQVVNVTPDLR